MSDELSREVATRILSLRNEGETWKAFAERHGLTPQSVSNWRSGRDGASLDAAAKVLELHTPRLSPAWVLVGLEPRYLPEGVKMEDVVREELGNRTVRLKVIGKIADGKVSLKTLETIEEIHHLEARGVLPADIRSAIAKIRKSGATAKAGP